MNVRTFVAGSMAEALEQVKRGLGSDAVVLHTRTYKRGGVFGLGAKTFVEVTAADGRELGRKRGREAKQSPRAQRLAKARASTPKPAAAPRPAATAVEPSAGDLIRKTYFAAQAQFAPSTPSATASATPTPTPPTAATPPTATPGPHPAATPPDDAVVNVEPITGDTQQLAREMQAVRQMVARVMHQQSRQSGAVPATSTRDPLFEHYLGLIEQEVAEELAEQIVNEARAYQDVADAVDPDDDAASRAAVRRAIEQAMPIDPEAGELRPTEDGQARVVALVGPTGVGKTTTVAKLAATFKLKQGKDVALITLDTYRIAAVDQLKTYAGILGVPLEIVTTPDEMAEAVARHAHRDGILIDTAGRSQRDNDRLTELAALVRAANPHETHLVLSSTATQRVLLETVERFSAIHTDRIIFTKLDEAVTFGTLINIASKVNKKLSYLTTGQEVPHQIEAGKADRLAALVMGDSAICL